MCIGAGVTVVVVHEGGLPQFARILGVGGRALTEAIASELDLAFDAAEALKRQSLMANDDLGTRARAAIERPLSELLEEIRGSLDFYRTQPDGSPIAEVLLNGGGSQLPGLAERLGQLIDLPDHPRRRAFRPDDRRHRVHAQRVPTARSLSLGAGGPRAGRHGRQPDHQPPASARRARRPTAARPCSWPAPPRWRPWSGSGT